MWPFTPSKTDMLLAVLREEREARSAEGGRFIAMAEKLIDASTEHAKLGSQWLGMFSGAGKPEVRTMTDGDEAFREQARTQSNGASIAPDIPHDFDPAEWFRDLRQDFMKPTHTDELDG